jgi:hypothetical protein
MGRPYHQVINVQEEASTSVTQRGLRPVLCSNIVARALEVTGLEGQVQRLEITGGANKRWNLNAARRPDACLTSTVDPWTVTRAGCRFPHHKR